MSTDNDGTLYLSDTITIGDRVYTADCGSEEGGPTTVGGDDDVGNTQDTATFIATVHPEAGSGAYEFTIADGYYLDAGDVDFFRLEITQRVNLSVATRSSIDTKGVLYKDGRIIDRNDDGFRDTDPDNLNFFLWSPAVDPGTYYVKVEGYTTGFYALSILLRDKTGAGKAVAEADLRDEARVMQLTR